MRLLHIADIHIGVAGHAFGERAVDLRDRIQKAFARALKLAPERDCDLVVVAGDLFDSNRVGQSTVQRAVNAMEDALQQAPGLHIILIPGNHDCLGEGSVYHAPEFDTPGERFHLITDPEGETVQFPDLDAAVHAVPYVCSFNQRSVSMLERMEPDPDMSFNIGVVHAGHPEQYYGEKAAPEVTADDIAESGMDYIALGHIHSAGDCDAGGVVARYPGPLELISSDCKPGAALIVDLDEDGVRVQSEPMATLKRESLEILGAELTSTGDLRERIAEVADKDTLVEVSITGMLPVGVTLNIDRLLQEFRESTYRLNIDDRTIAADLDAADADFAEELVIGQFVRLMQEKIEEAREAGDERALKVASDALNYGVHLLRGGDLE